MGFVKTLIGLPVLVVVLVFAFVNNDLATFNLWPFAIELTVPLSVAILFFVIFGFVFGGLFSWLSYAPVRKDLRRQKKKNKKLSKQHQLLSETVSDLQGDLEQIKAEKEALAPSKTSWRDFFRKKKNQDINSENQ